MLELIIFPIGMMESLREELRDQVNNNIQTTVVEPDLINTSADYMKYIVSRYFTILFHLLYYIDKFTIINVYR